MAAPRRHSRLIDSCRRSSPQCTTGGVCAAPPEWLALSESHSCMSRLVTMLSSKQADLRDDRDLKGVMGTFRQGTGSTRYGLRCATTTKEMVAETMPDTVAAV